MGLVYLTKAVVKGTESVMNAEKISKELQERIHKVCELVQQFDDGELSYQGLDNELHNLYSN